MTGAENDELEFTTKPKARDVRTFTIDGHPVTATKPKDAFIKTMGLMEGGGSDLAKLEAIDLWLERVFDTASAAHLKARLDDADDDFDLEDMGQVNAKLLEVWADRPTTRPSASRGRQRSTGKPSTARSR